ncbi:thermonuclease family protein [Sphingobium baderi]|uniref:thermonuclease family protein n=1 Tax=Sphingobium baderi TaxID=1332080 RepID=UPI002B40CDCF|nr:thermonuclease family protein [Sphingobium baderi]WRD77200.1 thermonuclease family protein [Sphingobium baderi]
MLDGDTFKLRKSDKTDVTIRLEQIDAPEKRQPWSNRSKQMLTTLLGDNHLCILGTKQDRYGRLLGEVHVGNLNVNSEMIRLGGAWAYRQYLRDDNLLSLEREAKDQKRGLWSMPANEITPPWEFRKAQRENRLSQSVPVSSLLDRTQLQTVGPVNCSQKRTCRQMASCAEAKQWLRQCGGDGIDGDRDGVPCERMCNSPTSGN